MALAEVNVTGSLLIQCDANGSVMVALYTPRIRVDKDGQFLALVDQTPLNGFSVPDKGAFLAVMQAMYDTIAAYNGPPNP